MLNKIGFWALANLATLLVFVAGGFQTNCFILGYEPDRPSCLDR